MTFRIVNDWAVESTDGYRVEMLGRLGLDYSGIEGNFHFDTELQADPDVVAIYLRNTVRINGNERRKASAAEMAILEPRLKNALKALGIHAEFFR